MRSQRIIQALHQHPAGLCLEVLLASLQEPADRQAWLKALRKLEAAGQVVITVPSAIRPHRKDLAGALVRMTT